MNLCCPVSRDAPVERVASDAANHFMRRFYTVTPVHGIGKPAKYPRPSVNSTYEL